MGDIYTKSLFFVPLKLKFNWNPAFSPETLVQ